MSTTRKEQSESQMNVKEVSNLESGKLFTREAIEGTPFTVIGNDEKGYFVSLGRFKVIRNEETLEGAIKHVREKSWEILMNVCQIIASETFKEPEYRETEELDVSVN